MVSYSSGTVVPPNTVLGTGEKPAVFRNSSIEREYNLKRPYLGLEMGGGIGSEAVLLYWEGGIGRDNCNYYFVVPQAVKHCKLYLKLYFHASLDTVKLCNLTIKLPIRSQWYCDVWGLLWNICDYNIIFLIAILSITRTISVLFPFLDIR